MKTLEEKILRDGTVLPGNILKVDNFVNHMIEPKLFMEMAEEFYEKFKDEGITKILTIEVSGIGVAFACGLKFDCPILFAKKTDSKTLVDDCYTSHVYSYTKDKTYEIRVAKKFLQEGENVLIIDDFLANGKALEGLIDLCEQAKVNIKGIGIVIEKAFQEGGKNIRSEGYDLLSLARIKEFKDGQVIFCEEE